MLILKIGKNKMKIFEKIEELKCTNLQMPPKNQTLPPSNTDQKSKKSREIYSSSIFFLPNQNYVRVLGFISFRTLIEALIIEIQRIKITHMEMDWRNVHALIYIPKIIGFFTSLLSVCL